MRRCGKISVKYVYSRNWSVMSSEDELCFYCGSSGYIKCYYFGLSSKVKNWFETNSICRKMLCYLRVKGY